MSPVSVQNTDRTLLIPLLLPALALRAAVQDPIHLCFSEAWPGAQTPGLDFHFCLPKFQAWVPCPLIFY